MKMKSFILAAGLFFVSFSLVLASCTDDDNSSYVPTYKGFAFSRSGKDIAKTDIYVGDTITVTAVQATLGHLINKTTYSWSITSDSLSGKIISTAPFYSWGAYDDNKKDPSCTFVVPAMVNTYTINFVGSFNYSGAGKTIDSTPYDSSDTSVSGTIYTSGSSALKGIVKGNVSFTAKSR
jgi:hypothetical protein